MLDDGRPLTRRDMAILTELSCGEGGGTNFMDKRRRRAAFEELDEVLAGVALAE